MSRRHTNCTATVLLLSLIFGFRVEAGTPELVNIDGMTSFGAYEAIQPKSIEEIPEPARSRIVGHLRQRLGDAFFNSLKFSGGQVVDIDELHRKEPNSWNYQWEIPAYILVFELRLSAKGVEYYQTSIECRLDGSVVREINLPDVTKNPDRAIFVSFQEAMQAAAAAGFDLAKCGAEIQYLPKDDRCVYRFRRLVRHEGVQLFFKNCEVDAHSGKLVRQFSSEAIE